MAAMRERQWHLCESEAEWLALRAQDLTSTDVAALFGLSPYLTAFELWWRKKNGETVTLADNERMRWGRRLERTIAEGVAEDQRWTVEPLHLHYCRLPDLRVGSSFDYRIIWTEEAGPLLGLSAGLLEIKNVGLTAFRANWTEDTAPPHIELQLQHQLFCSGLSWGYIVPLVGGNEARRYYRQADPAVAARIEEVCSEFWASIEAGTPPAPDFTRDSAYIIRSLRAQAGGNEIESEQARELVEQYQEWQETAKEATQKADECRAKLLLLAGDADVVRGSWGRVLMTRTKDNPGTVITPEMVGQVVGARKGYRQFRVTLKQEG